MTRDTFKFQFKDDLTTLYTDEGKKIQFWMKYNEDTYSCGDVEELYINDREYTPESVEFLYAKINGIITSLDQLMGAAHEWFEGYMEECRIEDAIETRHRESLRPSRDTHL